MEIVAGALAAGANEVARSETLLRLAMAGRMRAEVEKAQAGLPNMSSMATGTAIRFIISPFPWMSRFFCGIFESFLSLPLGLAFCFFLFLVHLPIPVHSRRALYCAGAADNPV